MVNIGENIKEEMLRQERTVSWLARKLNCTRAAVYRIFAKNSIDTALLINISQILHRDFFRELSEEATCKESDDIMDSQTIEYK